MKENLIAKLTLDTFHRNKIAPLVVPKGDYGARVIQARIKDYGNPISVGIDDAVSIVAKRSGGGDSLAFSGRANQDGTVTVPVTQWMLDIPEDDVVCHIVVTGNDYQYSTTSFLIQPQEKENPAEISEDDPRVDVITEVLANENARISAENERVSNEEERKSNEEERKRFYEETKPLFVGVENFLTNNNIAQGTGNSPTVVMSQKAATDTFGIYAGIDRTGKIANYLDGYYHLSTGKFVQSPSYVSSIYFPVDLYESLDKTFRTYAHLSFTSFRNGGVYVGYLLDNYVNADGENVDSLEFDEFAICLNIDVDWDYDKIWFDKFITDRSLQEKILPIYDGEFNWLDGYYRFSGNFAGEFVEADTHKSTPKINGALLPYVQNLSNMESLTKSGLAFWKNHEYVGNKVGTTYYYPNGTATDNIDFDEFSIVVNVQFDNYLIYTLMSFNTLDKASPLYGKKLGVIGDSNAYGAGYAGGYGGIIGNKYNMTGENRAISGATLVPTNGLPQILPQLNNLSDDCDYIILEGGFNDSWYQGGNPIGEYSADFGEPTADGTFYGNLNYLLYNALVKFHGKKMCFVIVHQSKANYSVASDSEYYRATVKLCNKWGIPIVDLNKECPPFGMVSTSNPLYNNYTSLNGEYPDGVHPNEAGYRAYYVPKIVSCLESL